MPETRRRALTKAITYRAWQSANTFLIALLFTQEFETAAKIVSLEVVVKIAVYYWHERIWTRIGSKKK